MPAPRQVRPCTPCVPSLPASPASWCKACPWRPTWSVRCSGRRRRLPAGCCPGPRPNPFSSCMDWEQTTPASSGWSVTSTARGTPSTPPTTRASERTSPPAARISHQAAWLRDETGSPSASVVAHSLGGLVLRWAMATGWTWPSPWAARTRALPPPAWRPRTPGPRQDHPGAGRVTPTDPSTRASAAPLAGSPSVPITTGSCPRNALDSPVRRTCAT